MHVAGRFVPDVAHHVLALRIPGALAGAFAVVGGFRLGRRLVRPEINLAATAMAAFFFFPVYYSREVYCYPYVLLCAAFAFLHFHQSLFDERRSHAVAVALFLWSAALGLTHFGCSVALAAMDAAAILLWIGHARAGRAAAARRAAETAVACALAGLAAAPYWARILLGDSPHVAMESPYSLFRILNDMVAKFFLGDRLVPNALAWGLFAVGLIALARRREDPVPGRVCVGVTVATALALAILAKKSQYTSVRYFAMLAPLVYLVFAQGLWSVAQAAGRLFRRERAGRVVFRAAGRRAGGRPRRPVPAGAVSPDGKRRTLCHHGPLAQRNLPPGSPYCSIAAASTCATCRATTRRRLYQAVRIAGNGPGFMDDVRARQRQVLARFPVRLHPRSRQHMGRSGWLLSQRGRLPNPPLRKLRERGIFPDVENRHFEADGFDILYNEPADALAMARAAASPSTSISALPLCGNRRRRLRARHRRRRGGTGRHNLRERAAPRRLPDRGRDFRDKRRRRGPPDAALGRDVRHQPALRGTMDAGDAAGRIAAGHFAHPVDNVRPPRRKNCSSWTSSSSSPDAPAASRAGTASTPVQDQRTRHDAHAGLRRRRNNRHQLQPVAVQELELHLGTGERDRQSQHADVPALAHHLVAVHDRLSIAT
jgi:hypothetical protein